MKKLFLIVMLFAVTSAANRAQAVPKWLGEMFGCSWQWIGSPSYTVLANGQCKFTQSVTGSSWLWGSCGTETYEWVTNCETPFMNRPPLPEGPSYQMVAGTLENLRGVGYVEIDPNWTDPEYLESYPGEFQEAVVYRLYLAGYIYNSNWEYLVEEPCPVPGPSTTVYVAQANVFFNQCPLSISPNPSTGVFTVDISGFYNNVTKIQVVSNSTSQVIYQKLTGFAASEQVDISSEDEGYYTLIVYTLSGNVTELIQKTE